jgi:hypothetical protein
MMPAQAKRGNLITMVAEVSYKKRRHVSPSSFKDPLGVLVAPETVGVFVSFSSCTRWAAVTARPILNEEPYCLSGTQFE